MAIWPSTLPAPQKKLSITPGDTRTGRRLQSGRTEFRRFGNGKPDQLKVLFRLLWAEWDIFKEFHTQDLNLSLNWFSADWLATLGYSAHKAKILGYPREVARQGYYVDIVCMLLIQKTAWIIGEDTEWPCATTGGAPLPPGEYGYIYGGFNGSYIQDCDQYTPNVWVSKTDMLLPVRAYLAASTIGSSGYIYGGHDGSNYLQDCDKYTPDTWTVKSNILSPARAYLAASTIGSSGYIYGGRDASDNYLQDCDQYTPDVWVSKSDMPSPGRGFFAASTIGSSGYVYGGIYNFNILQDCDQYTPNTWTSKTNMPNLPRWYLAASTIGSSGYTYGGRLSIGGTTDYLQDCDQYTPDVWVSKSDMPLPKRACQAASTIESRCFSYGGSGVGSGYLQDCLRYDPITNIWQDMVDMPNPARSGLAASTI